MLSWDSSLTQNKQMQQNCDYYNAQKKNTCDSVKKCVGNAVKTGNHVMFAHLFIHNSKWRPAQRFADWCYEFEHNHNGKLSDITFIKTQDWRNPTVLIDEKTNMSDAIFSGWRNAAKNIDRDNLAQLALYLGMTSEEANDFFLKMGKRSLYSLDIVDAIEMFYLDYFHDKKDLKYIDKLKRVKAEINNALTEMSKQGLIWIEKSDNSKKKDKSKKPSFQLLHEEPIGKDIIEELSVLRERYDKEFGINDMDIPHDHMLTMFMTKYFDERLKNAESFRSYFNPDGFSEYPVFTERRYGYLKRTLDYLFDWEKYKKNLMPSNWKLTGTVDYLENTWHQTAPTVKKEIDYLDQFNWEQDSTDNAFRKKHYEDCIRLVHYIETLDCIGAKMKNRLFKPGEKYKLTVTRKYIEGEEASGEPVTWEASGDGSYVSRKSEALDSDTEKGDKEKQTNEKRGVTVKELSNKKSIMEYAIATGHEEDLGNYLRLAGYWKKDWYSELCIGALKDIDNSEAFEPDQLDALYLYAMMYRDALIDRVVESKMKDYDQSKMRVQIREAFPMRELLTVISRDISYIFTICENKIHLDCRDEIMEDLQIKREKEFGQIRNNMLFPIEWYTKKKSRSKDRTIVKYNEKKEVEHSDDDRELS